MLPLKLSNTFVLIMTQKQKALRHAVCMKTCTSHAGYSCATCVVPSVLFAQWKKKILGPLSGFAKWRSSPCDGQIEEACGDAVDSISKL